MAHATVASQVCMVCTSGDTGEVEPRDLKALRHELLHGDGFAVLQHVGSKDACNDLREAALRRANLQPFDGWPGVNSKRVKDPLEWGGDSITTIMNALAKSISPLLDDVLGPRSWITSLQVLALFPTLATDMSIEREEQIVMDSLHSDYPFGEFKEGMDRATLSTDWQFPVDCPQPRTLQLIVVLDEFTKMRGATRMLPASSRFDISGKLIDGDDKVLLGGSGVRIPSSRLAADRLRFEKEAVAVEAAKGDCLIYVGHTWHTIAVNRGTSPRVALLAQVSPYYFAPLEAAAWTTPLCAERRLSYRSRELLGLPGTTVEGAGGEGGADDARVPHRDEARPLLSCAFFAADTVRRAGPASLCKALGSAAFVATVAAGLGATLVRWHGPAIPRAAGQLTIAVGTITFGYILGATATIRRFDF